MPCYHPLKAGLAPNPDKPGKKMIIWKGRLPPKGEAVTLPCGQCWGCRLEQSRQWATRLTHENSQHKESCFITLTYNKENLPGDWSLHVEHFQKFIKRLRKKIKTQIKYFHAGEYGEPKIPLAVNAYGEYIGERLGRPHYHALIFGYEFKDKKILKAVENGGENYNYYTSEELTKIWGKGYCLIGDITWKSAAYVARYAMKKITGDKKESHYERKKPEYITMSRRPAIGTGWYKKYKDGVFPWDEVIINGYKTTPPRFYDKILEKEDETTYLEIKRLRLKKKRTIKIKTPNGIIIVDEGAHAGRLKQKEAVKKIQLAMLARGKEEIQ